jgi:hypothetical protein
VRRALLAISITPSPYLRPTLHRETLYPQSLENGLYCGRTDEKRNRVTKPHTILSNHLDDLEQSKTGSRDCLKYKTIYFELSLIDHAARLKVSGSDRQAGPSRF